MGQKSPTRRLRQVYSRFALSLLASGLLLVGLVGVLLPSTAVATAGINQQINFQGRLLNTAGAVVADGNYNMRFKIYCDGDGVLGGTDPGSCTAHATNEHLLWTETRQNSASAGVAVKNGYFSVQLGSVASLSGVDFNQSTLWLSMELTTNGTDTGGSPTYNGEMTPFKRLSSAVYALQAQTANTCTTCILQSPANTAQNTISPTQTLATVALTVNANTSGAASTAMAVNQTQAADGVQIGVSNTSGTAANGLLVAKTGAGTLTSALSVVASAGTITNGLSVAATTGTLTNGVAFSGTIGTDILRASGTLTVQGSSGIQETTGGAIAFVEQGAGVGTVSNTAVSAAVVGVGTLFTQSLKPGDTFTVTTTGNTCTVSVITDATHLTCGSTLASASTASAYTITSAGTRMTILGNGNVGVGVTSPLQTFEVQGTGVMFYSTGSTNQSVSTGTNWFRTAKNTVTVFVGDNDSTSGYTSADYSGDIRFNGSGVAWGDVSYHPNGGGSGNNGQFILSTAGSTVSTTPNAKLGVGDLYANGSVGIGKNNPTVPLDVVGAINSTTSVTATTSVLSQLFSNAGALALTTTASNGNISITPNGSGDVVINQGAGSNLQVTATAASTVDQVVVSNSGFASTTTGVDGLQVTFGSSNASGDALHVTPSYAGGATDALTYNALEVDAFSPTNAAGTDSVNGLTIGALTDPGASITSRALNVGTGWDNVLTVGGTAIINGSGVTQVAGGGTGQTTIQAAINSLSGLTTEGDLLFRNATNSTRLARGSNGECLTSNTTTILWGACSSGSLAKNLQDTSVFAVPSTGTPYLYAFQNTSSAVASGLLQLDNGNNTGSALRVTATAGNLIDLQNSSTSVFKVTASGKVGINTGATTPTDDLTFGNAANRVIRVLDAPAATNGNDLTVITGAAGASASNAFSGGDLGLTTGAGSSTANTAGAGGNGGDFVFTGGLAQSSNSATGNGGTGGGMTVNLGNGGTAANTGLGGAGGSFTIQGGTGGNQGTAGGTGGAGGDILLRPGVGGTGTNAGRDGLVQVGSNTTNADANVFVLDSYNAATEALFTSAQNVNGAMYYNTNTSKFRCYQGGWTDCISTASGFASTTLNNLGTTSINAGLLFDPTLATAAIGFNGSAATAHNLTVSAQTASGATAGGTLTLQGGNTQSGGTDGTLTLDAGSGATTANGTVNLGVTNSSIINIGTGGQGRQVTIGSNGNTNSTVNILANASAGATSNIQIGSGSSGVGTAGVSGTTGIYGGGSGLYLTGATGTNGTTGTSPTGIIMVGGVGGNGTSGAGGLGPQTFIAGGAGGTSTSGTGGGGGLLVLRGGDGGTGGSAATAGVGGTINLQPGAGGSTSVANGVVQVGSSTANAQSYLFGVDNYNVASDPTNGFNGAMYYNSNAAFNSMRCFQNGSWSDCTSDLQAAYNMSTATPEIQLNTTQGALQIRQDSGATLSTLFQVQNAAGTTNYLTVTNNGIDVNTQVSVGDTGTIVGRFFRTNDQAGAGVSSQPATYTTGAVNGAAAQSGDVVLRSGDSSTSGNTGFVFVTSGDAASGVSGDVNIKIGSGTTGVGQINIGDQVQATGTKRIDIGSVDTNASSDIRIATSASLQAINVGSTTSTSKITLSGGALTTSNGVGGVQIANGYNSTDTTLSGFVLDSSVGQTATNFTETANTCTASVNGGAMYYNSAPSSSTQGGSNAIRACINGAWEDLVSTAGMGIMMFGVVPDSGSNPGDLPSLATPGVTGPCKVSWASATTVTVAPCVAYSGGRKVIVTARTLTLTTTTTNLYENVCLTGTNGAPALVGPAATQNSASIVPAFSLNNPILCLATLKNSSTVNGNFTGTVQGQIYDTRTFTTTQKEFVPIQATIPGMGQLVIVSGSNGILVTANVALTTVLGVVVATSGTTSTGNPTAIIATAGPAYVVANGGVVSQFVQSSGTAGFANTAGTAVLGSLGISRYNYNAACNAASTCMGSLYLNLHTK